MEQQFRNVTTTEMEQQFRNGTEIQKWNNNSEMEQQFRNKQ